MPSEDDVAKVNPDVIHGVPPGVVPRQAARIGGVGLPEGQTATEKQAAGVDTRSPADQQMDALRRRLSDTEGALRAAKSHMAAIETRLASASRADKPTYDDIVAINAMQGLIASGRLDISPPDEVARLSYVVAEAMGAERKARVVAAPKSEVQP